LSASRKVSSETRSGQPRGSAANASQSRREKQHSATTLGAGPCHFNEYRRSREHSSWPCRADRITAVSDVTGLADAEMGSAATGRAADTAAGGTDSQSLSPYRLIELLLPGGTLLRPCCSGCTGVNSRTMAKSSKEWLRRHVS
jgi:hypothetical protein